MLSCSRAAATSRPPRCRRTRQVARTLRRSRSAAFDLQTYRKAADTPDSAAPGPLTIATTRERGAIRPRPGGVEGGETVRPSAANGPERSEGPQAELRGAGEEALSNPTGTERTPPLDILPPAVYHLVNRRSRPQQHFWQPVRPRPESWRMPTRVCIMSVSKPGKLIGEQVRRTNPPQAQAPGACGRMNAEGGSARTGNADSLTNEACNLMIIHHIVSATRHKTGCISTLNLLKINALTFWAQGRKKMDCFFTNEAWKLMKTSID
jgi:hypothetical protein